MKKLAGVIPRPPLGRQKHGKASEATPTKPNDDVSMHDDGTTNARRPSSTVSPQRHGVIMAILALQLLWAVAIPLKNVIIMPYPQVVPDAQHINSKTYNNDQAGLMSRTIAGTDVYRIVHDVVHLSLNNSELLRMFMDKGDFVIDEIGALLTPAQYALFAQYYGVVFQASEFPAAGFIPAEMEAWSPLDRAAGTWTKIKLTCPPEWDVMQGMTCIDQYGDPCDDSAWDNVTKLSFKAVDLRTLTNGTGWQNKASLMTFVSAAHNLMRSLFAKRDWEKAYVDNLDENQPLDLLEDNKTLNYTDDSSDRGVRETAWDKRDIAAYLAQGYRHFQTCLGTELIFSYTFGKLFAVDIVQSALTKYDLFTPKALQTMDVSRMKAQWQQMFQYDVMLTSGAGQLSISTDRKMFCNEVMTEVVTAGAHFKRDRAMTGTMHMGHSGRNLQYMSYYPDTYYSFLNNSIVGETVLSEWRQLGAYFAGYNGFKFDFTHNTMVVQRLSERTKSEGTGYAEDWFEQEKQVAKWYRNHELASNDSMIKLATAVWGSDGPPTNSLCLEGFYRKIAQTTLVMAMRLQPVINHVAFQSMSDPDAPSLWFAKQMLVNEIVGENIGGYRVSFPFPRDDGLPTTGSTWPLIPFLSTFARVLGPDTVINELMTQMNTTFLGLIEVEFGRLSFHDAVHCPFGFGTLGVLNTDERDAVWAKIYKRVVDMVNATVHHASVVEAQMQAAMPFDVTLPREFVAYTRTNGVFKYEGSPLYWRHVPLGVGMIKLATRIPPTDEEVQPLRDALVCYNTLEMRYLNVSTRCWAEPKNAQETIIKISSEGLRTIKFSMWSLGIVLNILGAVISLRYVWRVVQCWLLDRLSDLTLTFAFGASIQGIGLIAMDGIVIMSFSCLPMIMTYHLPVDPQFLLNTSKTRNKYLSEFWVLLSLTWYIRFGIELGTLVIKLKYPNWWFKQLVSRTRFVILLLILLIRLGLPIEGVNYNQGLVKVVVSCALSIIFGFLATVASVFFDKPPATGTLDPVSDLLKHYDFKRNKYGVIGQLQEEWSHSGMTLEGWKALKADGHVDALVYGATGILPVVDNRTLYTLEPMTEDTLQAVIERRRASKAVSPAPTASDAFTNLQHAQE